MALLSLIQTGGGSGSSSSIWNNLQNATGNLTLSNTGFSTTFDQTSAVAWTWANTTAATSSTTPPGFVVSATATQHVNSGVSAAVNTTGATLLVAVITWIEGGLGNIADSQGNTWNYLTTYTSGGSNNATRIAYAYSYAGGPLATSATHTFTVSGSSGAQYFCTVVQAFSGTLTTAAVYETSTGANSGLTSPFQIGSITPTTGDIIVSGFGTNSDSGTTASINAGFSTPVLSTNGTDENCASSYLLGSSGAVNPTWTTNASSQNTGVVAAFKPAASVITSQSSPVLTLSGTCWTGAASATDTWTIQDVVANATDGASTLTFSQSGSPGVASIQIPSLQMTGTCLKYAGISTVSQGIPAEYATLDLTAQNAAYAATTLYAVPASATGMYRISWSATITTASDGTSVLGGGTSFQVVYTSPTDSVSKTTTIGNGITSAANTTGTAIGGTLVVYAKTGTNIQVSFGYTSVQTTTAMVFELHAKCEAM